MHSLSCLDNVPKNIVIKTFVPRMMRQKFFSGKLILYMVPQILNYKI